MEAAIISSWECPSCGNIIKKEDVLKRTSGGKYCWEEPASCACGRKGKFKLIEFTEAVAEIRPK